MECANHDVVEFSKIFQNINVKKFFTTMLNFLKKTKIFLKTFSKNVKFLTKTFSICCKIFEENVQFFRKMLNFSAENVEKCVIF